MQGTTRQVCLFGGDGVCAENVRALWYKDASVPSWHGSKGRAAYRDLLLRGHGTALLHWKRIGGASRRPTRKDAYKSSD